MLIRMLETKKGAEDGITVKEYVKNHVYELHVGLAKDFVAAGFAEFQQKEIVPIDEDVVVPDLSVKAEPPLKNKAMSRPDNKSIPKTADNKPEEPPLKNKEDESNVKR